MMQHDELITSPTEKSPLLFEAAKPAEASAKETQVDVSIVIVSFNTRQCLEQCLSSLFASGTVVSMEILVVDNGSTDGSCSMVAERFPTVRLMVNSDNVGFARASNQGIKAANGQFVLLLNSDVIVPPGTVDRLIGFMWVTSDCGIAGTKLLNSDGSFQASYARFPSLVGEFLLATRLHLVTHGAHFPSYPSEKSDAVCEADWVGGACLVARREAIEEIGSLDEDFFMYGEEVDWCYRMKKSGRWKVYYLPDAPVVHLGGQSTVGRRGEKRVLVYRGKLLFFRKHYRLPSVIALRCLYTLTCILKLALSAINRPSSRQDATSYKQIIAQSLFDHGPLPTSDCRGGFGRLQEKQRGTMRRGS